MSMTRRTLVVVGTLAMLVITLGVAQDRLLAAIAQEQVTAPRFEVDPLWPKPLPNHWLLGSTIGVGVDSRDHVYIVHRGDSTLNQRTESGMDATPPQGECCRAAPPILEFDPEGNLVNSWGGPGPGYDWPISTHGVTLDDKDNVWLGAWANGDSHILKFTRDGKFLLQVGKAGQKTNSNATDHFGRVAKVTVDGPANEAYVADGYGNKRVAVVDATTGAMKRFWGAYGNVPSDSNYGSYDPNVPLIPQFRSPVHCAQPSTDGMVYVCDRKNDRIQVFTKAGKFVKEKRIAPLTLSDGSVWDIAFSRDPQQKYLYLADGKNNRIYVMDRQSLEILTQFGDGGRQPGQWFAVHSIATDSKGNIYTTETYEGKRVQKFVYKGIGKVAKNQGVAWPRR
jgi:hypothetical protein